MEKYYLHNGSEQLGPFEIEELKSQKISKDTPIWHEGMADWGIAGDIPEFKDFFTPTPPPFKKVEKAVIPPNKEAEMGNVTTENTTLQPKGNLTPTSLKKKYKMPVLVYLITGSLLLIGIIAYLIYNQSQEKITDAQNQTATATDSLATAQQNLRKQNEELQTAEEEKQRVLDEENSPEKLRQKLLEKEKNLPTNYLLCYGTLQENITQKPNLFHHTIRDGYIINGYIGNKATLAMYKDAIIVLSFYTATNTFISDQELVISEYFRPRSTTKFGPYKIYPPQGYALWRMQIKNATPN